MKRYSNIYFVFCSFFILALNSSAQNHYWIEFADKNDSPYSIYKPQEYLSDRAIQRRFRQNIQIDEKDLPVNKTYIDQVLILGAHLVHSSKWLNGITVKTDLPDFEENVLALSFVKEVEATKTFGNKSASVKKFGWINDKTTIDTSFYGLSVDQISQIKGHYLHQKGYRGKGMHIAVLDAGFYKVDEFPAFDSLWNNNQILGAIDLYNNTNIYDSHTHGMKVLSIMGGNIPGQLIGAAPEASYWLLRTEDGSVEFKNEEDTWVVGAEFADSVGVDIINSSLGYSLFDDPAMNHSYKDMDGNTTRVTRAANIAASRGMLVFSSAGNEGNDPWFHIIAPSDGDNVIAVGAVDAVGRKALFSSFGPSADGEIKPNISAMGYRTALQSTSGEVGTGSGTSFSSPVLAGMAACLWQAYPEFRASEIKQIIEESAHQYDNPDSLLGYGIPNFEIAAQIADSRKINIHYFDEAWWYYPNPFNEYIVFRNADHTFKDEVQIEIFGINGTKYYNRNFSNRDLIYLNDLEHIPSGVLIVRIKTPDKVDTYKFIKNR